MTFDHGYSGIDLIRSQNASSTRQRAVFRVVLSLPCARKKAQERGTEQFHRSRVGEAGGRLTLLDPSVEFFRRPLIQWNEFDAAH